MMSKLEPNERYDVFAHHSRPELQVVGPYFDSYCDLAPAFEEALRAVIGLLEPARVLNGSFACVYHLSKVEWAALVQEHGAPRRTF